MTHKKSRFSGLWGSDCSKHVAQPADKGIKMSLRMLRMNVAGAQQLARCMYASVYESVFGMYARAHAICV